MPADHLSAAEAAPWHAIALTKHQNWRIQPQVVPNFSLKSLVTLWALCDSMPLTTPATAMQVVPNFSLKSLVTSWAERHRISDLSTFSKVRAVQSRLLF